MQLLGHLLVDELLLVVGGAQPGLVLGGVVRDLRLGRRRIALVSTRREAHVLEVDLPPLAQELGLHLLRRDRHAVAHEIAHARRQQLLLLLLDEALGRHLQLELHEVLESVVAELAVLLHARQCARVAEADHPGVRDEVLHLLVGDHVSEPLRLLRQQLAVDQPIQDHLFEALRLGHLAGSLGEAHHHVAVTEVVGADDVAAHLGGEVIVARHRRLARPAP